MRDVSLTASERAALEQWVASNCGEQVTACAVIADGLNLVVGVETDGGTEYVVRRPNELRDTPMFVDVETEYRTLSRLVSRGVPVPRPVERCPDDSVLGAPFLLTTRLDGEEIPLGSRLPRRYQHPRARERIGHELIDTLAAIHTLPPDPFEEVCETHTVADQVAADRSRVERAADSVPASFTNLLRVGDRLAEHVPETDHRVLVHGDYRPGNTLFVDASDETRRAEADTQPLPSLSGVLDWETPLVGSPLTEIGYLLLRWRDDGDTTPSLDAVRTHESSDGVPVDLRRADDAGLAPFTSAPGSPTRRQLLARYERHTGRTVSHLEFGIAHAAFTLAAVWTTLHAHAGGGDTGRLPWIDYLRQVAELAIDGEL